MNDNRIPINPLTLEAFKRELERSRYRKAHQRQLRQERPLRVRTDIQGFAKHHKPNLDHLRRPAPEEDEIPGDADGLLPGDENQKVPFGANPQDPGYDERLSSARIFRHDALFNHQMVRPLSSPLQFLFQELDNPPPGCMPNERLASLAEKCRGTKELVLGAVIYPMLDSNRPDTRWATGMPFENMRPHLLPSMEPFLDGGLPHPEPDYFEGSPDGSIPGPILDDNEPLGEFIRPSFLHPEPNLPNFLITIGEERKGGLEAALLRTAWHGAYCARSMGQTEEVLAHYLGDAMNPVRRESYTYSCVFYLGTLHIFQHYYLEGEIQPLGDVTGYHMHKILEFNILGSEMNYRRGCWLLRQLSTLAAQHRNDFIVSAAETAAGGPPPPPAGDEQDEPPPAVNELGQMTPDGSEQDGPPPAFNGPEPMTPDGSQQDVVMGD